MPKICTCLYWIFLKRQSWRLKTAIPVTEKLRQEDQKFKVSLGNFERPGLKIKSEKKAGDIAQGLKHLHSMCGALGSTPSIPSHNEGYNLVKFRLTDSSVSR